MKAIVIEGYGRPDRLLVRERPDPKPGAAKSSCGSALRELIRSTGRSAVATCGWSFGLASHISLAATSRAKSSTLEQE